MHHPIFGHLICLKLSYFSFSLTHMRQRVVSRWFSSLPLAPTPAPYTLCIEEYTFYIPRNTEGQTSPCLFLSACCGKNPQKSESLASVWGWVFFLGGLFLFLLLLGLHPQHMEAQPQQHRIRASSATYTKQLMATLDP